ncbi:MAG TPA: zinc ribbon domain-containing protein [Thermoanaerobaculia bacterium]|nr:zinc ribbon domain-containing protein [Thermoanaerobaculia bacterium]
MDKTTCAACGHEIDAAARICPYCGADPQSGEKPIDTQAILQEEFRPRHTTAAQGILQYARQRQGLVIAGAIVVGLLLLAGLHQVMVQRNESAVSNAAAVPLTDVTDLNNQSQATQALPMPELKYQYDGNPQTMRTTVVEQGAVPPPQQQTTATPQAAH